MYQLSMSISVSALMIIGTGKDTGLNKLRKKAIYNLSMFRRKRKLKIFSERLK